MTPRAPQADVDFGKTATDYATHRAGFPPRFYAELANRGLLDPEKDALDIGTGTGTVAQGLARDGLNVTAIDKSADMLAQSQELAAQAGLSVAFRQASAESLPFTDASFDLLTAGQCWHWFDRPRAAAEARRVLRPGGHMVIAHFDWLPLPGNVVTATEDLIQQANPTWDMGGGTGFYPAWLADLAVAGFSALETFSFDLEVPYSHEAWRGRIRASAGVAATLLPQQVRHFDRALADVLAEHYPNDPLQVPHRVWVLVARR